MGTYTKVCVTLPTEYPPIERYLPHIDECAPYGLHCLWFLKGIHGSFGLASWACEVKFFCVEDFIEILTPFFIDTLMRCPHSQIVILTEVELSGNCTATVLSLCGGALHQTHYMMPFSWSTL